uniref:Uncharacterized protein n=1 Tax=Molossus molossus TaxID=27622 RepID=A0A7J8ERL4_MOLMO|nr:hypothetical protein HJG59_008664 [Molossus molossus]
MSLDNVAGNSGSGRFSQTDGQSTMEDSETPGWAKQLEAMRDQGMMLSMKIMCCWTLFWKIHVQDRGKKKSDNRFCQSFSVCPELVLATSLLGIFPIRIAVLHHLEFGKELWLS